MRRQLVQGGSRPRLVLGQGGETPGVGRRGEAAARLTCGPVVAAAALPAALVDGARGNRARVSGHDRTVIVAAVAAAVVDGVRRLGNAAL